MSKRQFTRKYLGGWDGSVFDEILEFDPLTGQWKLVGRMSQARHYHAVSVIDFESELCVLNSPSPPATTAVPDNTGLIISGGHDGGVGTSVEIFLPSTGQHCMLPELTVARYGHTMETFRICGGENTLTSCLTLTEGNWEKTSTLQEKR